MKIAAQTGAQEKGLPLAVRVGWRSTVFWSGKSRPCRLRGQINSELTWTTSNLHGLATINLVDLNQLGWQQSKRHGWHQSITME
jgi:hypothetical protein